MYMVLYIVHCNVLAMYTRGPLEKGGCFAAKMGICGMLCVSLIINQSQPFPKRRAAVSQSDWAKKKIIIIINDIDIPC